MILKFFILLVLSLPGFCQEEDENLIDEVQSERNKQIESFQKIEKATPKIDARKPLVDLQKQLKVLGHETLDLPALMDKKLQPYLQTALEESEIRQQNPEFIRGMILGSSKGKPAEYLFNTFPVLLDITVDIFRDRHALPGLIKIFPQKEKLKEFFYIALGLFLFGIIFKRIFFSREWTFFKRFFLSLCLSLALSVASLSVFYYYFQPEVDPTVLVIKKYL